MHRFVDFTGMDYGRYHSFGTMTREEVALPVGFRFADATCTYTYPDCDVREVKVVRACFRIHPDDHYGWVWQWPAEDNHDLGVACFAAQRGDLILPVVLVENRS